VLDATFDLFVELGATDEQCEFPVVYASGLAGTAGPEPTEVNSHTAVVDSHTRVSDSHTGEAGLGKLTSVHFRTLLPYRIHRATEAVLFCTLLSFTERIALLVHSKDPNSRKYRGTDAFGEFHTDVKQCGE
jgi:hypothetical protein